MKTKFTTHKAVICSLAAVLGVSAFAGCKSNATSIPDDAMSSAIQGLSSLSEIDSILAESTNSAPTSVNIDAFQTSTNAQSVSHILNSDIFMGKDVTDSVNAADWELTFSGKNAEFMLNDGDTELPISGVFLIPYTAEYKGDGSSVSTIEASTAIITGPSVTDLNGVLNKIKESAGDDWAFAPNISSDNLVEGAATGFFWIPFTEDGIYAVTFSIDNCTVELQMPIDIFVNEDESSDTAQSTSGTA